MSRPQFRLSTLLWITLAVACWFGGMKFERWRTEPDFVIDHTTIIDFKQWHKTTGEEAKQQIESALKMLPDRSSSDD